MASVVLMPMTGAMTEARGGQAKREIKAMRKEVAARAAMMKR